MLIAGLFLVLVLTTIASYVMRKRRVRLGYVWLMLGLSALLIWFMMLFVPFERIVPLTFQNWFHSGDSRMDLTFAITSSNWAVAFALLSLHLFFLFIAATQPELNRDFIYLIVEAGEVALTFAILVSANLMTVIMTWTALDLAALLYRIFMREEWETEEVFYPFIFKLTGSLILIFTNAELVGSGQNAMLENLPVSSSTALFFAAVLHSGIFPYRPFKRSKKLFVTLLDYFTFFLPFISSLFLIAYLPAPNLPLIPKLILGLGSLAIVFYFSSRWLSQKDDLSAIHNEFFSFIGFLGFLFFANYQASVVHWFVILILCINYLLLYQRRSKSLRFFAILLILSMTGLPFSLVNYGSGALDSLSAILSVLGLMAFHVVWNTGFLRLLFKEKGSFEELDSSYQMIYMGGLGLALLSIGVITFRSLGSLLDELANWWIGVLVVITTLGIYIWQRRKENQDNEYTAKSAQKKGVIEFLTFQWFYDAADSLVQFMRRIVSTFSQILEGEGGVLWSIVLLALLFTLLKIG